jgi:hypothetical protein
MYQRKNDASVPLCLHLQSTMPIAAVLSRGRQLRDWGITTLWTNGEDPLHEADVLKAKDSGFGTICRIQDASTLERLLDLPLAGIAVEPREITSIIPYAKRLIDGDLTVYLSCAAGTFGDPASAVDTSDFAADALQKAGLRRLLLHLSHDDTTTLFNACRHLWEKHGIRCVADLPLRENGEHRLFETVLRCAGLFYENIAEAALLTIGGRGPSDWEVLEQQVRIVRRSLGMIGRLPVGYSLISCPTCGRCEIDITELAGKVDRLMASLEEKYSALGKGLEDTGGITVAVMGCNVNGPGEARAADIGIAGGRGNTATIFMGGRPIKTLSQTALLEEFEHMLREYIESRLLQGG